MLVVVRASDLRSVRLATKFMSKTATNCRRKRQHSRRFRQLCCRFRFRRLYLRQQFVAVSGDYSRRKRQQSVAVSGYYVAVSGNNVAVFGDYSFGNNLLPFRARRKRQQSVAVSGNNVAFGDCSFGNNLLPFSRGCKLNNEMHSI